MYVRLPDVCIFTELQDESLLIHKGWIVIKNANVYRIIGMLCFNALWQVHRFVSQMYGWIVYKINKLAPKWKKKSFPFVSVVNSFLSCLEGEDESWHACLALLLFPLTSKLVVITVSLKGRMKRYTHAFLRSWNVDSLQSEPQLPLLCLHLVITGRLAGSGF